MQSDARFEYQASNSRQPQNLQKDPFGFTCAPGMLCPIFADFGSPGDTYYIQHDLNYLRTLPLAAPAMIDVKVHYESFFVPIQMLYQPFEQSYFELTDTQSSFYTTSALMGANFPLFDYSAYVTSVASAGNANNIKQNAFRFADFMQLNPFNFCNTAFKSAYGYTPNFFPWQALAYHAIFEYVYRLDDKTNFSNARFNWDKYYATSTPVSLTYTSAFFDIYQRPWDFDYFTSMYRSPIVSDTNMQKLLPQGVYSDFSARQTVGTNNTGQVSSIVNNEYTMFSSLPANMSNVGQMTSSFGTAMIRQMFANEKLAMITGRTRKTYDAQVLAHFGTKVPHDPKHDIAKIGRDTYRLRVGEVTSLATTLPSGSNPGTALGDIAGKGYIEGGKSKGHKFTCPCHGVVMTIFSVEPLKRYFGGFAKQNAVSDIFDFPVPEFDKLGNQPMFRFEAGNRDTSTTTEGGQIIDLYKMTDQIGWNKRYQQWKSRYSRATAAFMPTTPDKVNQYNSYMIVTEPYGVVNTTYTGVRSGVSRPDSADRFYIDRHALDGLVVTPYADGWKNTSGGEDWEANPWLIYARDPFIVDSFEKVTKVSWMSIDGEPTYPW